jgi:hypothetical protein
LSTAISTGHVVGWEAGRLEGWEAGRLKFDAFVKSNSNDWIPAFAGMTATIID